MVKNSNRQTISLFANSKIKRFRLFKPNLKLSLLVILMGIFLLPNLAYLSTITPESLIGLTNKERLAAGLNALSSNQLLTRAAAAKAEAIIQAQNFSHTIGDKKFSGWVKDAGYEYSYVGENLAIDFTASESVMEAWRNSPLHNKNLLSPYYREIGLATIAGKFQGHETMVVVQIFGAPSAGLVAPPAPNGASGNFNSISVKFNLGQIENLAADPFRGVFFPDGQRFNPATYPTVLSRALNAAPLSGAGLTAKEINFSNGPYKFMIQPNFYGSMDNLLIIFTFLILLCLMVFLFYYHFSKIKKFISI